MNFDIRKDEPVVSVLVITYNHAPFIRQCLDSILMQETDFPYEVCIGEDESTDGTRKICMEYAERFPDKINLILRTQAEGVREEYAAQGNYNYVETLKECRGKYVADCDGDDAWSDPLKLQKQFDVMEADSSLSLVHSDFSIFNANSGTIVSKHQYRDLGSIHIENEDRSKFMYDVLTSRYKVMTCTAFSRRSALMDVLKGNVDLFKEYANGDTPMWCELVLHGSFAYIDEPLSIYRILDESATHAKDPRKRLAFYNRDEDVKLHLARKHGLPTEAIERQKVKVCNRLAMVSGDYSEIAALHNTHRKLFSLRERWNYTLGKSGLLRPLLQRIYAQKYRKNIREGLGFQSDSSARRMAKNGVYTAIRFGVYTLSGIVFIPFLKNHYGWGGYGLIALAGFLTQYVGLVSQCVGNAIARFLNLALNQYDVKQANEIYSTALVSNLGLILLQLPFFVLGIWKLGLLIDFSPEVAADFKILVACNVGVFFISMLAGVFGTPIQAANRLDISSTVDCLKISIRLAALFVLISTVGAKLWLIGVVDLVLALANIGVVYHVCHDLAPNLVFAWRHVTLKWIKPILNMAGWSIVTALGAGLLMKTDIWMINRFVDKEMAGVYAALLIWPNFLRQVSKQLASILAPVYMIDYAKGDTLRVARLSLSSAKLLGCFVAMATGFLFVVAEPFLVRWLGEDAGAYVALFRMMLVYLVFTIGEAVLWQIYTTVNKVHLTGFISLATGIANIILSMVLIHLGFGAMGVAIGTAISLTLSSALAIPLGVCREFKMPYRTVWWNHAAAGLILLVSYASTWAGWQVAQISWIGGFLVFVVLMGVGGFLSSMVVLSAEERGNIGKALQKLGVHLGEKGFPFFGKSP